MYNVSNFDFMRCCFAHFIVYNFQIKFRNQCKGTIFLNIYLKFQFFARNIFGNPCDKAYSLEGQHQNNTWYLANESKVKAEFSKVQSLFGPLMLALIGISNLVVIYFGGFNASTVP
jgi:ATP-binding cassette subfamily B protein